MISVSSWLFLHSLKCFYPAHTAAVQSNFLMVLIICSILEWWSKLLSSLLQLCTYVCVCVMCMWGCDSLVNCPTGAARRVVREKEVTEVWVFLYTTVVAVIIVGEEETDELITQRGEKWVDRGGGMGGQTDRGGRLKGRPVWKREPAHPSPLHLLKLLSSFFLSLPHDLDSKD